VSERGHFSSALEWLSGVPKTWETKPLYSVGFENKKRNKGLTEQNLLSLSYGRVIDKDINSDSGLLPESFDSYQIVEPGDLIFRFTDLQNDQRSLRSGLVKSRGIITSAYLGFRPVGAHPEFLAYLIHAYDVNKVFYGVGSGLRQSLNWQDVRTMPVPLPSIQDQIALTQYLDQETSRIDALVSKKEQLIEKLLERRRALITQVVTKGLDPNVPMKDSRVEWLGNIPQTFRAEKFKYVARLSTGSSLSDEEKARFSSRPDDSLPYVSSKDVSLEERSLNTLVDLHIPTSSTNYRRAKPGSFLMVLEGGSAGRKLAMVDKPVAYGNKLCEFRGGVQIINWLFFVAQTSFFQHQFQLGLNGLIGGVSPSKVGNFYFPQPERNQLGELLAYLDQETAQVDTLVTKTRKAIELLKERRQALITQVVTGKIDVRGFAGGNS